MRKNSIFLATMILILSLTSCNKETIVKVNQLPDKIREYIKNHFSALSVTQVTKDREGFQITYDVLLSDMTKLEFNKKDEVKDIESQYKLPDSVIPAKILQYVNNNYPGQVIKNWELDDQFQQVELSNGLELNFTSNADFSHIDN